MYACSIVLQKSLPSSPEEKNDANNKDDTPDVRHFDSHPLSDDCNKESYKNKSLNRPDKSTKQDLANNTSYSEGVLKCLFFLIYCLNQFVHCKEHQASDGKVIYQYTASLSIVSVYFNTQVIQELHSMIHLWKELCNVVIQYWPEGVECLEEVSNDEIQRWKKLEQVVLLQCCRSLCGTSSSPTMLQYWDLDHFFSLPVDLNSLNSPCTVTTLQIAKFGNRFFDDVLLVRNTASTSPTAPHLFVSIFGLFPHYKLLLNQHFKSFSDMGRQASDRSNNSDKRSQSETSKRSGSAGSNTSSSTTEGGQDESIRRTGSTGSCGRPGRGDDEDDGGQKRDRPSRYTHNNTPYPIQWEEEEENSNDCNETASATTAPWPLSGDDPCKEPGKSKTKKPLKTAAPIMFELVIRCSNGLDMLAVTSPMMNLPLSGDDSYDELPAATAAASNEILTIRCCCCEVNIYCGKVW